MKGKADKWITRLLCLLAGMAMSMIITSYVQDNNHTLTALQQSQDRYEGRMLKIINGTCEAWECHIQVEVGE
jgi:hypothetical protein